MDCLTFDALKTLYLMKSAHLVLSKQKAFIHSRGLEFLCRMPNSLQSMQFFMRYLPMHTTVSAILQAGLITLHFNLYLVFDSLAPIRL